MTATEHPRPVADLYRPRPARTVSYCLVDTIEALAVGGASYRLDCATEAMTTQPSPAGNDETERRADSGPRSVDAI